jgi:hypothetical protein
VSEYHRDGEGSVWREVSRVSIHVDTLVSRTSQSEAGGYDCDNQWTCVHV